MLKLLLDLRILVFNKSEQEQGQPRFDQPAFVFKKNSVKSTARTAPRPKLIDADGNALDVSVGNGSDVVVKVKPYSFMVALKD